MKEKYSGKQIIRAGEELIKKELYIDEERFSEVFDKLSYWRVSHAEALDIAFVHLQGLVLKKDKNAIFAKRLKRYISIVEKLIRFKRMKLKNMQDIGGARAVLTNYKKLKQVTRELKKSSYFRGEHNKLKFKDYIKKPKDDGYRSYHLIGKFEDSSKRKRVIEIQLRTQIQHFWATAVEIVDLFTDQALKSNQGDEEWKIFFTKVSEQFWLMDSIHLFNIHEIPKQFELYIDELNKDENRINSCQIAQEYIEKLDVFGKLNAFAGSLKVVEGKIKEDSGYVLLKIELLKSTVHTKIFHKNDVEEAEKEYSKAEKEAAQDVELAVALVSTSAVGDIKTAYPNYFANSTDFLKHLDLINKVQFK